jgi:hypothetical protein
MTLTLTLTHLIIVLLVHKRHVALVARLSASEALVHITHAPLHRVAHLAQALPQRRQLVPPRVRARTP